MKKRTKISKSLKLRKKLTLSRRKLMRTSCSRRKTLRSKINSKDYIRMQLNRKKRSRRRLKSKARYLNDHPVLQSLSLEHSYRPVKILAKKIPLTTRKRKRKMLPPRSHRSGNCHKPSSQCHALQEARLGKDFKRSQRRGHQLPDHLKANLMHRRLGKPCK